MELLNVVTESWKETNDLVSPNTSLFTSFRFPLTFILIYKWEISLNFILSNGGMKNEAIVNVVFDIGIGICMNLLRKNIK